MQEVIKKYKGLSEKDKGMMEISSGENSGKDQISLKDEKEKPSELSEMVLNKNKKICYVGEIAKSISKIPIIGIKSVKIFDKLSSDYQIKVFDNLLKKYFAGSEIKQNFYFDDFIEALPKNYNFDANKDSEILNHILDYYINKNNQADKNNNVLDDIFVKIKGSIDRNLTKKILNLLFPVVSATG